MVCNRINKIPVVRDKQQGSGILFQPAFEPQSGFKIQVVGRLVEQQEIRRHHQCLSQVQTDTPATGEVFDGAFEVGL